MNELVCLIIGLMIGGIIGYLVADHKYSKVFFKKYKMRNAIIRVKEKE